MLHQFCFHILLLLVIAAASANNNSINTNLSSTAYSPNATIIYTTDSYPIINTNTIITCNHTIIDSTTSDKRTHFYQFILDENNNNNNNDNIAYTVLFDGCLSSFDTYFYFYYNNWTLITKCDDCGDCYLPSRTQLTVNALYNGQYIFAIDGFSLFDRAKEYGEYNVHITCSNDTTHNNNDININSSSNTNTSILCCECLTSTPSIKGCNEDINCQNEVCYFHQFPQPSCCDYEWDIICAAYAEEICELNSQSISNTTQRSDIFGMHCFISSYKNIILLSVHNRRNSAL